MTKGSVFLVFFMLTILSETFGSKDVAPYSRQQAAQGHPGFGDQWIYLSDEYNNTVIGHFEHSDPQLFAQTYDMNDAMTFTLFTREDTRGEKVANVASLELTTFDKTKPTKIVTHGWMSSGTSETCVGVKDGFLRSYDANVFIIDWRPIAHNLYYPTPMMEVPRMAQFVTEFLNDLLTVADVAASDIHLVGHSLGAHVVGIGARMIQGPKVARVTGLDPARPGFDSPNNEKISRQSADFVDIIHTCAGYLGLEGSLGHADFFPNTGGPPQPGCDLIPLFTETCSHSRSWEYFIESLQNPYQPFYAESCNSYEEFMNAACARNDMPIKMGDPTPTTARGNHYLNTDKKKPYSMGLKGLHLLQPN